MPTGREESKKLLSVTSPSVRRPRSSSAPETPTSVTRKVKSSSTPGPTTSSAGAKTRSVLFPSRVTLKVPARTASPSHSQPSHTMAHSAATTAMAKFGAASRKLMHFGERINLPNPRTPSASLATCVADLTDQLRPTSSPSFRTARFPRRLQTPPCDIDVFAGDYVRWPTFRDLFTAIYIQNPRLSPVEKLYHLTTKTSGDPKAIVEKSPLTNDGFEAAWNGLRDRTCRDRHHTLLPRGSPIARDSISPVVPSPRSSDAPPSVQNYFASGQRAVLLGTAIINICHLGTNFRAHALIDPGSEATFITERLFNIIKLPFRLIQALVSGLNRTVSAQSTKICHFAIHSTTRPDLHLNATAYVLPELAGYLPSYPIPQTSLRDLPSLAWADPTFHERSQIDVLIGSDILPSILLSGSQTNICGSLLGQETIFVWVLTSPVPNTVQSSISSFSTQDSNELEAPLDQLLTKF
ncbi:GL14145 [Drosophila persimilis]|uniref:GL14145 n=1 Tax=Drosophila persimilis TaxID=7234 RepID=B4HCM0_DROPE|nr:GL14145 [Drosophila persimilis]